MIAGCSKKLVDDASSRGNHVKGVFTDGMSQIAITILDTYQRTTLNLI